MKEGWKKGLGYDIGIPQMLPQAIRGDTETTNVPNLKFVFLIGLTLVAGEVTGLDRFRPNLGQAGSSGRAARDSDKEQGN